MHAQIAWPFICTHLLCFGQPLILVADGCCVADPLTLAIFRGPAVELPELPEAGAVLGIGIIMLECNSIRRDTAGRKLDLSTVGPCILQGAVALSSAQVEIAGFCAACRGAGSVVPQTMWHHHVNPPEQLTPEVQCRQLLIRRLHLCSAEGLQSKGP
jgi:hypothetical protein